MRIEGIGPADLPKGPLLHKKAVEGSQGKSFKETLNTFLENVNQMQSTSSAAQRAFLTGETNDVHRVMSKSEEAKVAFNMLMEIRNKTLEAYNEILRMRL